MSEKQTGTTKVRRMKAKKTGRIFIYEVYTTAKGDLHVARLIEWAGGVITNPTWGEPCDTEEEAMKSAFHVYADPRIEQQKRDAEYYRSGGY
jgi:hypothetical protein